MKKLQSYLASDEFTEALSAQGSAMRLLAIKLMTECLEVCKTPPTPSRRPSRPRRSTKWNEANKARFRAILLKDGIHAAARAFDLTIYAANLAAKRHVPEYVRPATMAWRIAA